MQPILLRASEVQVLCGTQGKPMPASTMWHQVRTNQLPPQIHWGRSARWVRQEVETVLQARIAGASPDDIRLLIGNLVEGRKAAAGVALPGVAQ